MLLIRKLIIVVLTLGLVISLSSPAISGDRDGSSRLRPLGEPNPNAHGYNFTEIVVTDHEASTPSKPYQALQGNYELINDNTYRACHQLSYYGGVFDGFYALPDPYGDDVFAMRFTPEYAGTLSLLQVVAGVNEGAPDLMMHLWTVGGDGLPDVEVASWYFDNSTMPPPGYVGWFTVDPATDAGGATFPDDFIFNMSEEFYIGFSCPNGDPGVNSLITVGPDNGTEMRSAEVWLGAWEFFADGWGYDVNFWMRINMCYDAQQFENCYYNYYACPNPAGNYYWREPNNYGMQHQTQRFDVTYPETLHTVSLKLRFLEGGTPGVYRAGTPDLAVYLYPDAGGYPDIGNPYTGGPVGVVLFDDLVFNDGPSYTPPVPPVPANWTTVNIEGVDGGNNLVMTSDYWMIIAVNNYDGDDTLFFYSDFAECGAGRTILYDDGLQPYSEETPGWYPYSYWYGVDINFQWAINACQDIYSDCFTATNTDYAMLGGWELPDGFGVTAFATSFTPLGRGGEVGDVWWALYNWSVGPVPYAYGGELALYTADPVTGFPASRIVWYPIPGDGVTPGWFLGTTEGVFVTGKTWLVLESFEPTGLVPDMVTVWGNQTGGEVAMLENDVWVAITDGIAPWADAYLCCLPLQIRACAPDGDWPTMGKNQAHDNSSFSELGNIQCELTLSWTYHNPGNNGITFASPIIADGKVFGYFFNSLRCIDLATGTQVWARPSNYAEIGGSCRATPTYKDGYLYCGGGDNGYFGKFNAATGATEWAHISASHEQYGPNAILDVDGTEVIFYVDGAGNIYGRKTSDGDNYYYPGTNTPCYTMPGQVHKGMTTDGTYLYVGCDQYLTTPDVRRLAVSATGVTTDWSFVDDGPGWQLDVIDNGWTREETSQEGVYHTMLYSDEGIEGQWLYFIGSFAPQNQSPVHNGGILYALKADGTALRWTPREASGTSNGAPGGMINDKAQVIFGGWSNWIEGGEYYGPIAYSKATGAPQWGPRAYSPQYNIQEIPDEWGHVNQAGVLSCENYTDFNASDWLIFGQEFGWWNFAKSPEGVIEFHRRSARWVTYTVGPVMDDAGHLILAEGNGYVHCLTNQAPRQRLHIADMRPETIVPFGLTSNELVTFPDLLVNKGCTDLEIIHVELLDEDNGTFPNGLRPVDPDRAEAISAIAQKDTGYRERMATFIEDEMLNVPIQKTRPVTAAFALPDYIIGLVAPTDGTIIPAGGAADIVVNIDGTKIPRGVSQFYAEIQSDDPDYFLDSAYQTYGMDAAFPTVLLSIVGGCVYDFTHIYFGPGGANQLPVYNSTRFVTPDGSVDGSFIVDDEDWLYGCDGLFYSWAMERVVMHATDGGGNETWESILPDPLPTCDFAEANDVVLAEMSDDGAAYSNVLGTIINYAYVDSMEDHRVYEIDEITGDTLGVDWVWDIEFQTGINKPYAADLTEGYAFKGLASVYAVTSVEGPKYGFEDFYNFVIHRHALYSRYGNAINGVYVGMVADWDIHGGGTNLSNYNEEYSISWIYEPTNLDFGGGVVKVPFGPGYTPMINSVDATTAWYGGEEPGFDSIYVWMTRPSTQFMNYAPYPPGTDRRLWSSIARIDMPAWAYTGDETDPVPPEAYFTYGIAFFGKLLTTNDASAVTPYMGMATIVNKFCGFGRGDVNDDGAMNLVDIVYLNNFVFGGGNGPFPFKHLGDVDGVTGVNVDDITYMINWYFNGGPVPISDWALPQFAF